MPEAIRYRVTLPRPHNHRFEIEAEFPAAGEQLTVALPVWTPGSYLVREFSRHLQHVTATTLSGDRLPVTRIDKRSFRVTARGQGVRLRYGVYANELTVRTSHLDGTHASFNGANLFLYDEARRNVPHRVAIDVPAGWSVFTALEREGAEYVAADYDELVDSPFELGPHTAIEFEAAGVPHQFVVVGEPTPDPNRLAEETRQLVETEAALFGGLPADLKRYVFFLYMTDKGRGGLEHKASTALLYPRGNLGSARGWEDLHNLIAHEYFHLWNVKRIKPRAFVPFDYAQENYTRLLWFFEGVTSYYDMLLTRRAGLTSAPRYLLRLGETLTALHGTPGRKVQSLEEASMQAWVKHYRPDENSPNSAISYYLKGEVVAWLLDLHLRRATGDQRSLDDVMRLLWQRYGDGRGVPEDGIEAAAAEVAGIDLSAFFDHALRSTEELDYSVLSHIGLEAHFRVKESPSDKGGTPPRTRDGRPRGWLGLTARPSGTISWVAEDSPAMNAGIYADDEVIAVDGFKVDGNGLIARAEDKAPGETLTVTLFRRDRLMEVEVTLGEKPQDAVYLTKVENPTPQQQASFAAWVGAPWSAE
ncbi:MAG: M61 family metallopeptidase [Myxococcaceae bacterium]|nr:M61 family metallopeptidase [Myxococcaceae bacterium]